MLQHFKKFSCATIIAISSTFSIAEASIIDTNQDSFIDTETGLEWMDFGINSQYSYDYVTSQLDGGIYDGWEVANLEQARSLFYAFSGVEAYSSGNTNERRYGEEEKIKFLDLVAIVGITDANTYTHTSLDENYSIMSNIGFHLGTNGLSVMEMTLKDYADIGINDEIRYDFLDNAAIDNEGWKSVTLPGHSTYLVRTTSVPEPSTLAIFSLAMIGLVFRKFKK